MSGSGSYNWGGCEEEGEDDDREDIRVWMAHRVPGCRDISAGRSRRDNSDDDGDVYVSSRGSSGSLSSAVA